MELDRSFGLLLVLFTGFFSLSQAFNNHSVGGKDGWVLHPSENYNHWAERNRFQVNDSLIFKYKKGSDSVLFVNEDDYKKCNRNNPILKMESGESVFKFNRSGPFFFISGNSNGSCEKGQRLHVIVLAVRTPKGTTPVLPPSHAPATTPTSSPKDSDNSPSADVEAPSPSPSSAWRAVVNPSALLVTVVTMVLAFTFGSSVNAF